MGISRPPVLRKLDAQGGFFGAWIRLALFESVLKRQRRATYQPGPKARVGAPPEAQGLKARHIDARRYRKSPAYHSTIRCPNRAANKPPAARKLPNGSRVDPTAFLRMINTVPNTLAT